MFGKFKIIIIAVAVIAFISFFHHISGLKASLAISEENAKKLTAALDAQQAAIEQMRIDQERIQEINSNMTNLMRQQNNELNNLRDTFKENSAGRKRELGNISIQRPGLVQNVINKGTENALRCLEIASGSELTEGEKNATKRSEINSSCPKLANPNFIDN